MMRVLKEGMTLVELMVTILIAAVLAVTLCIFFVKLLNIHEQEREEAYVREKLVEICGAYADYLSIATTVSNVTDSAFVATYRQETGGVSLETGRVSQVTQLNSRLMSDCTIDLDIGHYEKDTDGNVAYASGFARDLRGDALLMNLTNNLVVVSGERMIAPLDAECIENAHLVYLQVSARCRCKSDKGKISFKNVTAGRIVRLWNKK